MPDNAPPIAWHQAARDLPPHPATGWPIQASGGTRALAFTMAYTLSMRIGSHREAAAGFEDDAPLVVIVTRDTRG